MLNPMLVLGNVQICLEMMSPTFMFENSSDLLAFDSFQVWQTLSNSHQTYLGKAFRNLISGEDNILTDAYARFHKMVEQEQGVVKNLTLAGVAKLNKNSSAVHTDIKLAVAAMKRTDGDTKAMRTSLGRIHRYIEGKTLSSGPSLGN